MQRSPSSPSFHSRRRHPRIEVLGELDGRRVPLETPITVRDLSQGGFSAEGSTPFPPGTRHCFRFTTPDGTEVALEATAIHCRLASASTDGQVTYITGFEFVSDEGSDAAVTELLAALTSIGALD